MNSAQLHRSGVCLLAARIAADCIAEGSVEDALRSDDPTPLDVALDWAVMCGLDGKTVAHAIVDRYTELNPQEPTKKVLNREWHYSRKNRCSYPGCRTLITNNASVCKAHKKAQDNALCRQRIRAFTSAFCDKFSHGPTTSEIARGIGYRGHGLRPRHLDKMPLVQDEYGRWELRQ